MNNRFASPLLGSVLVAAAATAHGQNAYTSFGPGETFNVSGGYTISGPASLASPQSVACEFTSLASGDLINVTVAAGSVTGTNAVDVSLYADNSGSLGTLLESWTETGLNALGADPTPFVLNSVTSTPLTTGENYWVLVAPGGSDTWAAWNESNGVQGNLMYSTDSGASWNTVSNTTVSAFSVAVTPEPASFLVLGLGAVPLLRRKKRVSSR